MVYALVLKYFVRNFMLNLMLIMELEILVACGCKLFMLD